MDETLIPEPEIPEQIEPGSRPRLLGNTLRRAGAVMLASAALAGGIAGHAKAASNETILSSGDSIGLAELDSLPGSKLHVSQERINTQSASTVKILIRNPDGSYSKFCSGEKVNYKGRQDLVAFAAHCVVGITGFDSGIIDNQKNPNLPPVSAVNIITPELQGTLFIGDPSVDGSTGESPIADVQVVSVDLRGKYDLALAKVGPREKGADTAIQGSIFESIPSVSLEQFATTSALLGQEVAQSGFPADAGGKIVNMIGRLVGYLKPGNEFVANNVYGRDGNVTFAVTALDSSQPGVKECLPGASGSGASLAAEGTEGGYLFGLSRYYEKYGSIKTNSKTASNIKASDSEWQILEKELNVKIPEKYDLLCMYTIPGKDTFDKLIKGFNRTFSFPKMLEREKLANIKRELLGRHNIEEQALELYKQLPEDQRNNTETLINKIQITGDAEYIDKTKNALRLIDFFQPDQLSIIKQYIDIIGYSTGASMIASNKWGGRGISQEIYSRGPLTYAGYILASAKSVMINQEFADKRAKHIHFTNIDFMDAFKQIQLSQNIFLASAGFSYTKGLDDQ